MSTLKRLIHEAHRRSLWQVLGIYAVASWVVFEVVQTLTEGLSLPGWFPSFAFVLLLIGLPIVLATAFVQEGGPGGRKPEDGQAEAALIEGEPHPLGVSEPEPFDAAEPAPTGVGSDRDADDTGLRTLFTWRRAITGGVLAFALWGVVAAAWILFGGPPPAVGGDAGPEEASVAVLPFDNLSGDEAVRPFTEGVHDDLLTQLAKIESLKVISRTSVLEYRETSKSMREIAAELGVAAVVEGGVQRAGDRLRVNAQLIDAGSDQHLWAETFDRRLTAENVFEIQSELARRIAAALRARLTPDEEARIAERPTDDLEAYDFFVRGQEYRRRSYEEEDMELAVGMFQRAVAEDSAFTEAWAALSEAHSFQYLLGFDRTEERLARAKAAVDRALAMEPENPHGRLALGLYHYRGFQDYDRALSEYGRAADGLPGDAGVHTAMGGAHRRAGNWERALEHLRRAAELNPRSAQAHYELGGTYYLMRRYSEVIPPLERAIALAPEWDNPYGFLRDARIIVSGDVDAGARALERFPQEDGNSSVRYWQRLYEGDLSGALEMARAIDDVIVSQQGIWPRAFWVGKVLLLMGREEPGRTAMDSARADLEERLEATPEDPRIHTVLGETYAWLGRGDAAVRHGRRAVELYPVEKDALEGPSFLAALARIHAVLGHREQALDLLERVMAIPGRLDPANLRYDPEWGALRDDPRFRALLEPFE